MKISREKFNAIVSALGKEDDASISLCDAYSDVELEVVVDDDPSKINDIKASEKAWEAKRASQTPLSLPEKIIDYHMNMNR